MSELEFGKRYTITGMMRKSHYSHDKYTAETKWNRYGFKPGEGIFIGYRTLQNGIITPHYEEQASFKATEQIRVCLFVINARRNPIYVHPEDVKHE